MTKVSCHFNTDNPVDRFGVSIYYADGKRTFIRFDAPVKTLHRRYENKFNDRQNRAYDIAVYGPWSIDQRRMGRRDLRIAYITFRKAQKVLFKLKNEVLDRIVKEGMQIMFPEKLFKTSKLSWRSCIADYFSQDCHEFYGLPNRLELAFLGITKEQVIKVLVRERILDRALFNL